MKTIRKKLNIFKKGPTGFAILFSVTLSAIILSIALGVVNIALKEVKFSTSARSTNEAFFAADTGMECALINDKSTSDVFVMTGRQKNINCFNQSITVNRYLTFWDFIISGMGSNGQGCAKVTVMRVNIGLGEETTITSKGYDVGGGGGGCVPSSNSVEREIEITY